MLMVKCFLVWVTLILGISYTEAQQVTVDVKTAEQVVSRIEFGTVFNKLTQAEALALLSRNNLIVAGATFEDIPGHLRPAGVLQQLYWAPYKGQRLVGNPGQAYQKLIDAYKKNPFKTLNSITIDYNRLMDILNDEAKSDPASPVQPFRALVNPKFKSKLDQSLAEHPEIPQHVWSYINEAWTGSPKKLVSPQVIADQLAQNPEGLRVLYGASNYDAALVERLPNLRYGIFDGEFEFSPSQYLTPHPGASNPDARYRGPWMEIYKTRIRNTGLAEAPDSGAQGLEPYLRALKAIPGVKLDGLVLDREDSPSWWNMLGESTPDGTPALVKMTQDPRYQEYVRALGFEVPYRIPGTSKYVWRHGDDPSSKFNALNYSMQAQAIETVGRLHQEVFPGVWWMNYFHKHRTNLQPQYRNTQIGASQFSVGATVGGGIGSGALYGDNFILEDYDLGLSSSAQAVNRDDWEAFRGLLTIPRTHCWASTLPFMAFHTSEHSAANLEAGRMWEETLIHSMMANTHPSACFPTWIPSTSSNLYSEPVVEDFVKLNAILAHISQVIGRKDRRYIPPITRVDYTTPIPYSRLDVGGEVIWRVSAPPTGTFAIQVYGGDVVFRTPTAYLRIPRGTVIQTPSPYVLDRPATDLAGDANHDGKVDFLDLAVVRQNRSLVPPVAGDLNQDGKVDASDFQLVDETWMNGTGQPRRPGGYWVRQRNRTGTEAKLWEQQRAVTAFLIMFVGQDSTVFPDR